MGFWIVSQMLFFPGLSIVWFFWMLCIVEKNLPLSQNLMVSCFNWWQQMLPWSYLSLFLIYPKNRYYMVLVQQLSCFVTIIKTGFYPFSLLVKTWLWIFLFPFHVNAAMYCLYNLACSFVPAGLCCPCWFMLITTFLSSLLPMLTWLCCLWD